MMQGRSGSGASHDEVPTVVVISVVRAGDIAPTAALADIAFVVRIHAEATSVTWQHETRFSAENEIEIRATLARIDERSTKLNRGVREEQNADVDRLGQLLGTFLLGAQGNDVLDALRPDAVMLDVDESVLSLPWILASNGTRAFGLSLPFGQIVSTRTIPRATRNAHDEDRHFRVLAVLDPTRDLDGSKKIEEQLRESLTPVGMELTVLAGADATRAAFVDALRSGDHDYVHIDGHASFDEQHPDASAIRLADGLFTTADVLALDWAKPPYMIYNSTCSSSRSTQGEGLLTGKGANGLASAFLSVGLSAYIGHFWPVHDDTSFEFARSFYGHLAGTRNLGLALLAARQDTEHLLNDRGDLAPFAPVLFGDSGTGVRPDVATAA